MTTRGILAFTEENHYMVMCHPHWYDNEACILIKNKKRALKIGRSFGRLRVGDSVMEERHVPGRSDFPYKTSKRGSKRCSINCWKKYHVFKEYLYTDLHTSFTISSPPQSLDQEPLPVP
jgi:hypothetical protein